MEFVGPLITGPGGRVFLLLPFSPDDAWGVKAQHHVAGRIGPQRVRGRLQPVGDGFGLPLGPAWLRDATVAAGDTVPAVLEPEGPQRDALAPDIAEALAADPAARAFFDGLATFYRKGWLRWVDATRRRPEERGRRITEMVRELAAGHKERSRSDA